MISTVAMLGTTSAEATIIATIVDIDKAALQETTPTVDVNADRKAGIVTVGVLGHPDLQIA